MELGYRLADNKETLASCASGELRNGKRGGSRRIRIEIEQYLKYYEAIKYTYVLINQMKAK